MEEKDKQSLAKPEIDNGFAQYVDKNQLYQEGTSILTKVYLLKFYSHKGKFFKVTVSDEPNKNKPDLPSRFVQLGFDKEIKVGDYVKISIAKIKANITGYTDKNGIPVAYKDDRLEIKKIEKVEEKLFSEKYKDFITANYESEITEKVKIGMPFNDAIALFERKHRQNEENKYA